MVLALYPIYVLGVLEIYTLVLSYSAEISVILALSSSGRPSMRNGVCHDSSYDNSAPMVCCRCSAMLRRFVTSTEHQRPLNHPSVERRVYVQSPSPTSSPYTPSWMGRAAPRRSSIRKKVQLDGPISTPHAHCAARQGDCAFTLLRHQSRRHQRDAPSPPRAMRS